MPDALEVRQASSFPLVLGSLRFCLGGGAYRFSLFLDRRFINFHRRAGANQIPIPKHVVDSANRRPILNAVVGILIWTNGFVSGVNSLPVGQDRTQSMRCIAQRIVIRLPSTRFYFFILLKNHVHGPAEPIQFNQRLTFGRLNHERTGNREGHGWRVEPEVN